MAVTSLTISSSNSYNNLFACFGDIITISVTYSETKTSVTGTFNSSPINFINTTGNTYVFTTIVNELSSNGVVFFTVSGVGSVTDNSTQADVLQNVIIDTVKPTASYTVNTTGRSIDDLVIGDIISVSLTFSEILGENPKIMGLVKTNRDENKVFTKNFNFSWLQTSPVNYIASLQITELEALPHGFYIDFVDVAGNINSVAIGFQGGSAINLLEGSGIDIVTSGANNTITAVFNTGLDDNIRTVAVGGIAANTLISTLKNRPIVSVLEDILVPEREPTYTIPTVSIAVQSGTGVGTYEVGTPISAVIRFTGIKNDAGPFTAMRIVRTTSSPIGGGNQTVTSIIEGSATTIPDNDGFGFGNPNSPNRSYYVESTQNFTLDTNTVSFSGSGDYSIGLRKQTSKNNLDPSTFAVRTTTAPQSAANNFNTGSITYTPIYPYYWGVSLTRPTATDIATAILNNAPFGTVTNTPNRVLASVGSTLNISFGVPTTNHFLWFCYTSNVANRNSFFVTGNNNGPIGGAVSPAGNLFPAPELTTVTANNGRWNNIQFKVYISNYATTTDATNPNMELRT